MFTQKHVGFVLFLQLAFFRLANTTEPEQVHVPKMSILNIPSPWGPPPLRCQQNNLRLTIELTQAIDQTEKQRVSAKC